MAAKDNVAAVAHGSVNNQRQQYSTPIFNSLPSFLSGSLNVLLGQTAIKGRTSKPKNEIKMKCPHNFPPE